MGTSSTRTRRGWNAWPAGAWHGILRDKASRIPPLAPEGANALSH
jgi:hypothetical protein